MSQVSSQGSDRKTLLIKRMREETEKTLAFFRAVDAGDWERAVHSDDQFWTVRQILCHFLDAEQNLCSLVEDVLKGGEGAPEGYDHIAHNREHVAQMGEWNPAALLEAFAQARQHTLQVVETFADADLDRIGRHPAMGQKSLENILKMLYLHNKDHQREVQRAIGK